MNAPPESTDARKLMMYDANKKSLGAAYVLWLILGALGGHRFYLKYINSAVTLIVLTILWIIIPNYYISGAFGLIIVVWLIIDAFLIPGIVREHNTRLANSLTKSK